MLAEDQFLQIFLQIILGIFLQNVLTNIYVGDTAVGGSGGRVLDERPGGCWPIFYKIFTWIFI